jgi:outer membrane protein assembly factor BamB
MVDASSALGNANGTANDGNLLQYEWPQLQGDQSFTRFSAGPAPEAPDVMWKTNITGVQPYVTAFNGKVFVAATTNVIALDKDTGSTIWNDTLPALGQWVAVYKIDDTRLVIGKYCLEIETGKILWVSDNFSTTNYYAPGVYSPEEKIFYSKGKSLVQAWNFNDPSKPPLLAWEAYVPGGGSTRSCVIYGDGKVFPDSYDAHQMALDAKTGTVIWDTLTTGAMMFSGSYYQGRFLRGDVDNQFYCFNATTGKVLWVYNPNTEFGSWCYGSAAAYGMVYELNTDGQLYAIDVNRGQPVWKYKGPGHIFFPGNPVVADGKVYATTGQAMFKDPYTGEYSKSEFACLDAYTGELLWKLPIEAYAPRESTAIAYGSLYLIPGYMENSTDIYVPLNEVWAVGTKPWPMWRHDPEHSGTGQSGPTNITLRWKFATGGAVISSPSVVDGKVYVGSEDKNIYCLDARNGGLFWNFTTGFGIKSSPAVADGKVYIGPDDGYVYCLDARNGSLIWKTSAGGYIQANFVSETGLISSPTVIGGRVYIGSLDTNMYCLNAISGNIIWTFETAGYITSSPAVVDGAVYFTSQESGFGALYKLDANTGNRIWKLDIPYTLIFEEGTDMQASPTVADGMVFASSNKLERYGVNATTGKILWTYTAINPKNFLVDSMSYNDGELFFTDQFFIACVNATNGGSIWKSWIGSAMYASTTYADGKVYVATDGKAIYVLNATTGERLSWFETGSKCWSSPTLYEGRLYVGDSDWNVYCLAEYPALNSSVTIEVNNPKIVLGESVTGFGQLVPGMANASIVVTFVKPDGTVDDVQITTVEKGTFNFTYTPDAAGNWTITARWQSDKGYYNSAYSEETPIEVVVTGTGIPIEYFYAIVAAIAILVIVIAVVVHRRRAK